MQEQRPEGQVLLINKPLHWTSYDVVRKLKWHTRAKRVGHAGTLDPLATGLLVICTEKKTKSIPSIQDAEKEYTGTFIIGATTPSFDRETEPINLMPFEHISANDIEKARNQFTGPLLQVPPLHSAVKLNGQRAYKIARRGEQAVLAPKSIEIKTFQITRVALPEIDFRVVCSKGTYIRALARDFGQALGTGGYLGALCRTRIGEYNLTSANSIEEIVEMFPRIRPLNNQEKT